MALVVPILVGLGWRRREEKEFIFFIRTPHAGMDGPLMLRGLRRNSDLETGSGWLGATTSLVLLLLVPFICNVGEEEEEEEEEEIKSFIHNSHKF